MSDMYVIVMRCLMDDIPLMLVESLEGASMTMASMTPQQAFALAGKVGLDYGEPCSLAVIKFTNGEPAGVVDGRDCDFGWDCDPGWSAVKERQPLAGQAEDAG